MLYVDKLSTPSKVTLFGRSDTVWNFVFISVFVLTVYSMTYIICRGLGIVLSQITSGICLGCTLA